MTIWDKFVRQTCDHAVCKWGPDMTTRIARIFTDHPSTVGETYFGHMAFAAWFASRLGMAARVRGFAPPPRT